MAKSVFVALVAPLSTHSLGKGVLLKRRDNVILKRPERCQEAGQINQELHERRRESGEKLPHLDHVIHPSLVKKTLLPGTKTRHNSSFWHPLHLNILCNILFITFFYYFWENEVNPRKTSVNSIQI